MAVARSVEFIEDVLDLFHVTVEVTELLRSVIAGVDAKWSQ